MNNLFLFLLLIVLLCASSKLVVCDFLFVIIFLGILISKIFNTRYVYGFIFSFIIVWILFVNVNPYDIRSNKLTVLEQIDEQYVPKQGMLYNTSHEILRNLSYPIIIKPVRCGSLSKNVHIIDKFEDLQDYLTNQEYMYQEYISWDNEVGILYEDNKIVSIVKKQANQRIKPYCINCEDITHIKTNKLEHIISNISQSIKNFNVGRYDVRYENEQQLQNGIFKIVEANGTTGFDLRKDTSSFLYAILLNLRWFMKRLQIGFVNIATNNTYSPQEQIIALYTTLYNTITCHGWSKLFSVYT